MSLLSLQRPDCLLQCICRVLITGAGPEHLQLMLSGLQSRLIATADVHAALPLLEAALVAFESASGKGFAAQVQYLQKWPA